MTIKMNIFSRLAAMLVITFFVTSCLKEQSSETLVFEKKSGGNSREASLNAFKRSVHPIVVKNCASCHGNSGTIAPFFAVTDAEKAHDAIIDAGKVNFATPVKSRIVERPLNESHNNCGVGCKSLGEEMLDGVKEWVAGLEVISGNVGKFKTKSLSFIDSKLKIAQTEHGTVVLQAETAELIGRMKVHTHSTASDFKYIAGETPPVHPYGATERTGSVNGSCRVVTSNDLQEMTNGRFQVSERRRHIGQSGYLRYSMNAQATLVVPHLRDDYLQAITSGTPDANLRQYLMAIGGLEEGQYKGTLLRFNLFRVLPDFLLYDEYMSQVENSTSEYSRDFFSPRFGPLGGQYYKPELREIQSAMPDSFRRSMVYNSLKNYLRQLFFRSNNTPKRANEVPFYFRVLRDLETGERLTNQGNEIKYVQDATVAEQFYNHYFNFNQNEALNNVNGFKKIDSWVSYRVDPDSYSTSDFRWDYNLDNVNHSYVFNNIDTGTVKLNLGSFFKGSSNDDPRTIFATNFANTLHPILKNNCMNCHGDGSGRPQFASNNSITSFDAIASFIDFNTPENSIPAKQVEGNHQNVCGNNCETLQNEIITAIKDWGTSNTAATNGASSENVPLNVELSEADRTPARARYRIKVTESGNYNIWLKAMTSQGKESFFVRILDENERPIQSCRQNESCLTTENTYAGKSFNQVQDIGCNTYNLPNNYGDWAWYTPNIDQLDQRTKWTLGEGTYIIEVIERDINAKLDLIAISKNPEFNPRQNLIDEKYISDIRPQYLSFDLSHILNQPATFEIEVKQNNAESYLFRNPRIKNSTSNIHISGIKLLINDQFEVFNSVYKDLNHVVGTQGEIITYSPLVALSIFGKNSDSFAFSFDDLKVTQLPASIYEDDAPKPVEGRTCKKLNLFEETVMPILNRIKLVRKGEDGYLEYAAEFPGDETNRTGSPDFYTCTTCHTEEHIYFKMTTFLEDTETLCSQALSRVDFQNFERSLLLRGLNGTFNHPKLHFVESVDFTGSGNNLAIKKNTQRINGFDSTFIGNRFEVYTEGAGPGQINLAAYSNEEDRDYLAKFIGRYKMAKYRRYSDPYISYFGQIMTNNDKITIDPVTQDSVLESLGINLYDTAHPADYLTSKEWDPSIMEGDELDLRIKVRDECVRESFQEAGGIITDPCANNPDVDAEFEAIKSRYRQVIINWMEQEKNSIEN